MRAKFGRDPTAVSKKVPFNFISIYDQNLLYAKRLEEYETNADQLTNLGAGRLSGTFRRAGKGRCISGRPHGRGGAVLRGTVWTTVR